MRKDYLVIIDLWDSNILPVKPGTVPDDYREVYKSNLTFFVNALNLYKFKNDEKVKGIPAGRYSAVF